MDEIDLNMYNSDFKSPIYNVQRIKVWNIIGQTFNPNTLNSKSFSALQISIYNNGYAMSIAGAKNPIYDESFDKKLTSKQKIDMCINGSESDSKSGYIGNDSDLVFATQVSDNNIRKAFKWQIIDGSQRTGIIRMGTKLFMEDKNIQNKVKNWKNNINIPNNPGREMLKYIAWRENFSVPVAVISGKTDAEMMSAEILMNTARGSHSLDSMKDIVYSLINEAGMSEDWVAKNLFLDIESVKRMIQLSGLKSAYSDINAADLAWNPEDDQSYQRKQFAYLNREAAKFISNYIKDHPEIKNKNQDIGNIVDYAEEYGWDKNNAINMFEKNQTK